MAYPYHETADGALELMGKMIFIVILTVGVFIGFTFSYLIRWLF